MQFDKFKKKKEKKKEKKTTNKQKKNKTMCSFGTSLQIYT